VPEILKALDVFVLPSLTEGLPYVVLEAMACGLPVVATRAGGVPEVIQDGKTGILVAPGSEKELARGLAMLLRDGSLRRQLGTAARSHVLENFSEEKMLRETLSLYTQLIEAKVNKQCAQRIAI
jgi:glycosyltransferase involved in cell wall biosynthesis